MNHQFESLTQTDSNRVPWANTLDLTRFNFIFRLIVSCHNWSRRKQQKSRVSAVAGLRMLRGNTSRFL